MIIPVIKLKIEYEEDAVFARQRARQIAEMLGFEVREQTAIATSVSEIVRNAFNYGKGGNVEFSIDIDSLPQQFLITIIDNGPGINDLNKILEGNYRSKTGMGIGIIGSRRLMDIFEITSSRSGTKVVLGKKIINDKPRFTGIDIELIIKNLLKQTAKSPVEEVKQQNKELLATLDEVRKKQEELESLNLELEETNRGVVALYAELDERAMHFKDLNEVKGRFLSNLTHEFKTPLSSITALSNLLLKRTDGLLTDEQEKQVKFIQQSTNELLEMVSDLLDSAKIEAGKVNVNPSAFEIGNLFSALRGMMRPLFSNPNVELIFDIPDDFPLIFNDEAKITQILRNLISNALKFTDKGEVRVSAELSADKNNVLFSVSDTGIGIAEENLSLIFDEFEQVDNNIRKNIKGTGLGLPLSRKLAVILGGSLRVKSKMGFGSTFTVTLPLKYSSPVSSNRYLLNSIPASPGRPVLIIEDDEQTLLNYFKYLDGSGFSVLPARSIEEGKKIIAVEKPEVILLDILLPNEDAWEYLVELKSDENTKNIPVIIISVLNEAKHGIALGADDYFVKPIDRHLLLNKLQKLKSNLNIRKILIIDDKPAARYVLKEMLPEGEYEIIEAEDGPSGFQLAVSAKPDLIFLDLVMPGYSGFEVFDWIKSNIVTEKIPVIIHTSKELSEDEKERLNSSAASILMKNNVTRNIVLDKIKFALGIP